MIDDEIKGALNIDPSPEFLARVRTRIANEPAPSVWRWSWAVAAGGVLAAAVIVAIIWSPIESRPGPALQPSPVAQAFKPADTPAAASKPATAGLKPRATSHESAKSHESVVSGLSRQPEILVDNGEMRALQGLIAAAQNGGVTLTPAAAAAPVAPMELEPVTEIVIAPITIDPIAPLSGAEGVRP